LDIFLRLLIRQNAETRPRN